MMRAGIRLAVNQKVREDILLSAMFCLSLFESCLKVRRDESLAVGHRKICRAILGSREGRSHPKEFQLRRRFSDQASVFFR